MLGRSLRAETESQTNQSPILTLTSEVLAGSAAGEMTLMSCFSHLLLEMSGGGTFLYVHRHYSPERSVRRDEGRMLTSASILLSN